MLKKSFNMKKFILGTVATFTVVATGIGVYLNVNNGKENSQISFEQKLVAAAKKYVENNKIAIGEEITTTAEYLSTTGDFNRGNEENSCVENSYVIVKNENGEYTYKPVALCESPKNSEEMNLAIGYVMEKAVDESTPSPVLLITNSGKFYSITTPTQGNVLVTIKTNFPAVINSTTGNMADWTVSPDKMTFTKTFTENGDETIVLDDENHELGSPRTVKLSVKNIDRDKPVITGVEDGEFYTEPKTITFNEGTATIEKNGGAKEPFTSGTTLKDGSYTLTVTDEAGNSTTISFTIDTGAPTITLISDGKGSTINNVEYYKKPVTVDIRDTTFISASYTLDNGTEQRIADPVLNNGQYVTTITFNQPGVYVITATDSSSDEGFTATTTFVINTSVPDIIGTTNNKHHKNDVTIEAKDDIPVTATYTKDGGSEQSFTSASTLVDGKYVSSHTFTEEGNYTVSVIDAAGNTNSISFTVDKNAPTITGITNNGYYGADANIKINFSDNYTAINELTVVLTKPDGTTTSIADGSSLENYTDGTYTLTVTDKAGNPKAITFTVDTTAEVKVVSKDYNHDLTQGPVEVIINFNKPVKITSTNANLFAAQNIDELGYASQYKISVSDKNPIPFSFENRLGITGNDSITVDNIDITAPTFVKGESNITILTKENVEVTLTFSEPVKVSGTATYAENITFTAQDADANGYATIYKTTATGNGTINFNFEDRVGLTGSGNYSVNNIDNTFPIVWFTSNGKREDVTDLNKIYFFRNSVSVRFSDDRGTVYASYGDITPTPLINGSQIRNEGLYTINVTDEAGNTITVKMAIDKTNPVINGLENGEEINGKVYYKQPLNITFTDNSSNFLGRNAIISATYRLDGGEPVDFSSGGALTQDGNYTITAKDEAGNEVTKTFVLDATDPNVVGIEATPEELTQGNVKITVTFSESVVINTATFTPVDSTTPVTVTMNPIDENHKIYEVTITDNGRFEFTYADEAGHTGNTANTSYDVENIDRIAPEITVSSSATPVEINGINFYNKSVTVNATDNKSALQDLRATDNGNPYTLGTAITENGIHTIVVTDEVGKTATITFVVDTTAPIINGLENETTINGKTYYKEALNITFSDNSSNFLGRPAIIAATYTLNGGEPVSFNGGKLPSDGTYVLKAKDEAGNEVTKTFVLDTKAPTLVSGATNPSTLTNAATVTVTLTFSEPVKITENTTKFTPVNADSNGYADKYTVVATEPEEVISVSFEDEAGHPGTGSYTVTNIDRTAPVVKIYEVDAAGNVTDIEATPVKLNYYNKAVAIKAIDNKSTSLTASFDRGTTTEAYILGTAYSTNGEHTIKVTDEAGNEEIVTFVIDTVAPTVSGLENGEEINGKTYYKSQPLNITFSDNSSSFLGRPAVITGTYTYNNGTPVEFTDTLSLTNDGEYVINAKDEFGNAITPITFILDATNPSVAGIEITPEELTTGKVTVTVTFSENVIIKTATFTPVGSTTPVTVTMNPVNGNNKVYEVEVTDNGVLEFTYKDEANHDGSDFSYEIDNIDKYAPDITVSSSATPVDISGINFYNKSVTVNATDDKSEASALKATDNGNPYTLGTAITENGKHVIVVEDEVGRTSTITFAIDTIAPTVSGLENGVTNNGKTYYTNALNITFNDNSSNFLGRPAVITGTYTYNNGTPVEFTNTLALTNDGEYVINAEDEFGNKISPAITFILDTGLPTLVSGKTNPETLTNAASVTVTLTFSEPVKITENANKFTPVNMNEFGYADKYTVVATEPEEVINVSFEDEAGHPGTGSYTVTNIDRTAPVVKVYEVNTEGNVTDIEATPVKTIDGVNYYNKTVAIKATDNKSVVENLTAAFDRGATTEAYILGTAYSTNGKHTIKVTDEAGMVGSLTFGVDTEAPTSEFKVNGTVVTPTIINEKTYYLSKPLDIIFSDNSSNFLGTSTITGTYTYNNGTPVEFTNTLSLTNDGEYVINAEDEFGNAIDSITFKLDATKPMVTNFEVNPDILTLGKVKMTITFSEDVTIDATYKVIGQDTATEITMNPVNGSKKVYEVEVAKNGLLELIFKDDVNRAGDTFSYEVDNIDESAPEITVSSSATPVDISGINFYNKSVTVNATDDKAEASALKATDNGNPYTLGTAITENGKHVVVVEDEVGRTSTITFAIDTIAPTVSGLENGVTNNGKTYYTNALNITFSDNSSNFLGRPAVITGTYTYKNDIVVPFTNTLSLTNDGEYVITAEDEFGNAITPITFVLDTGIPTLVSGKTNPETLTNAATVTVTLTFSEPVKITENANKFTPVNANEFGYADKYTVLATEPEEVINVSFEDEAGHTGTGSYTVTNIDRTAPVVKIYEVDAEGNVTDIEATPVKTIDGVNYYNKTVVIKATDNKSVVENLTAVFDNGTPTPTPYTLGTAYSTNGKHTIKVTDEAGMVGSLTFGIDTTAPTVSGLENSTTINEKTYYLNALNITFSDNSSNFLDRPAVITGTYTYNNGTPVEFTDTLSLTNDGEYVINAEDEFGNAIDSITFILDTKAPNIVGQVVSEVDANGNVIKNLGDEEYTKNNVKVTLSFNENVTVEATYTPEGETTAIPVTMTPVNGNNKIYELVVEKNGVLTVNYKDEVDRDGSEYSFEVIHIDRVGPTIIVTPNTNGTEINGITYYDHSVTVNATDSKSGIAGAKDGNSVYTLGTEITENGIHTIVVTDNLGNENTVTFGIDTNEPTTNLENNLVSKTAVNFTATDAITTVTVTYTHTPFGGTASAEQTLTPNSDGTYTISEAGVYNIKITDQVGHTITRTVTIDSTAPVISVDDNSFHKVNVEFTVTDDINTTVTVTLDGSEITLTPVGEKYTATEEGVYTVTAKDEAENSSSKTFTIDKTAPTVKIGENEIVNGTVYDAPITFVVEDKTTVTVTKGENTPNITKNTDGSYTASENGSYELTLTDEAGNTKTVTFVVDKDAPETDLVGDKYYSGKVEFTVTDQTNVTVKASHTPVNNETATESTLTIDANGKYSVETDGTYVITMEDEAGHTTTRTFVIDSVPPVFNIANNSYHKSSVLLTIEDATELDISFDSNSINGGEANVEITADGYTVSGDGIYTFTAIDKALNETTVTFTIDTKAPVIKNIEDGKSYKSGVQVEVEDATLSTILLGNSPIINGSTVTGEGTYTLTATDYAGNETTITFTIDDSEPEITFPDDITVTDNAFETRKEVAKTGSYSGIDTTTITANEEVTITKVIKNSAEEEITEIPLTSLATYKIIYTIADEAGNTVIVTETVIVEDTEAPIITIDGNVSLIIVEKGTSVTYPNVTAEDAYVGIVPVTDDRETAVNINVALDYTVTFTATDGKNPTTETITVRVLDLDKLRKEERKLASLEAFVDPNGDKFASYNENKDDYTEESWNAKQTLIDELNNIINGNSEVSPETVTQEFVNTKMNAIEASKLQPKELDKTEYNAQIDRFNKLVETDYTEESWAEALAYKNQSIANLKLQSDLNYFTRSQLKRAIDDLDRIDLYNYANEIVKKFMQDYKFGDYEETVHNSAINKLINLTLPIMSNHKAMLKSELDKEVEKLRKEVEAARLPIDPTALENVKADLRDNYNEDDYTKESWKTIQDLIKEAEKVVADDGLRSEFKEAMDKIDLENLVLIPKVDQTTMDLTSSSNTKYAKLGDTLTLTFSGNKALENATVTINGKEATVTKTENLFTATVTVEDTDNEGKVSYTINPIGEETTPVTKESDIIVDRTNPTLEISASAQDGNNGWYKTNPTISIDTINDIKGSIETSGIDDTRSKYIVKNGETVIEEGLLLNGETRISEIPVTENGTITVTVVAYDKAGNKTPKETTVKVDKVKPVVTVTGTSGKTYTFDGIFNDEITTIPRYYFNEEVHISATDTPSGVAYINLNGSLYNETATFKSDNEINTIEVTDNAGNITTIEVVIDTSAPVVDFYQVDKNGNATETKATGIDYEEENTTYYKENLALEIKDNVDKTLNISAKFTNLEGVESDVVLTTNTETGISTAILTEEGTYTFVVSDDSGFTTTKTIVIDKTKPVIEGIISGGHYKDDVTIIFTERNLLSAVLKADGTSKPENIESGRIVTKDIQNGYNVTVTDKAGNTVNIPFRIDTTAPIVTLTTVEETPKVEVVDNTKTWYYKTPVSISFDDGLRYQQITATYTFISDKEEVESFENRELTNNTEVREDGTYTVTVTDKAGNTDTITFVVDTTVPVINKPVNNGVYGAGVEIDFTEGTAEIDGIVVEKGDKYAVEGTHTITVTDAAGNETSATFTVDTTAPIISGIPANKINITGLEITVKDATKTTVKIDGEIIIIQELLPAEGKTFSYDKEGKHVIEAIDQVGNVTKIEFTIDTKAPIISGLGEPITTDTTGTIITKYYNQAQTLTFSDDTLYDVKVNGSSVTLQDMKYTFDQDGLYEVIATDEAGHETIERFVIDTKAPTLTGVENKHYKERPTIGATDETTEATFTIKNEAGEVVTGNYPEGKYTVVATDRVGNTSETIAFVYDTTPPTITINGTVYHDGDVIEITENANNTNNYQKPSATAQDNLDETVTVKSEGNVDLSKLEPQTVTYTAIDKAGNETTVTLTITVEDNEAPTNLNYQILNTDKDIVNGWYIKPLKVKLSAEDSGTGVTKYEYHVLNNGTPVTEWITLEDFAEPTFEIPNNINGSNITLEMKAFDAAGNSITKTSSEYKLDQIAPTVTATINTTPNEKGWYKETIHVLLNGNDETSGVTHFLYQISLGNDIWTEEARIDATDGTATLELDSAYQSASLSYRIIAVDRAGHRSELPAINEEVLKLDTTAPIITIDNKEYQENATINKTEEASKDKVYNIPASTVKDNLDKNITVSQNGTVSLKELKDHELTYTAIDEAGNETTITFIVTVDDTTAPIITVNEPKEVTIRYGSVYEDLGATAQDNLDEIVEVSTSYNFDTHEVGTYTVTYTATDNKGNKATATRTVHVKETTTSEMFREENGCSETGECYNTNEADNYIWYSGHLWRVIKINEDNTVKLVTEEGIAGLSYGDGTSSVFKGSYAEKWLNTEFYESLSNANNIIVEGSYCNSRLASLTDVRYTCPTKNIVKDKVALLTMDEYNILGGQQGFLNTGDRFYTMTTSSSKALWIVMGNGEKDYGYLSHEPYSMRPVITISADVNVVSGKGTKENPYYIQKNETAASGTNLNKRYSGEYVTLNGHTWRIMKTDGASTRLIYDTFYKEGTEYARINFGEYGTFSTTSGVGKYLNETVYNSLFTEKEKKIMLLTKWYYNSYELGKDVKATTLLASDKYTYAYVGLASVGELMTGLSSTGRVEGLTSWTINSDSKYKDYVWHFSSVSTSDFAPIDRTRAIRPVIELNPDVKIKGGNGTAQSPYELEY